MHACSNRMLFFRAIKWLRVVPNDPFLPCLSFFYPGYLEIFRHSSVLPAMKLTLPPLGLGLATLLFITIAQPALAQVDDLAFSSFSTPGQANQSCLNDGNGIFICTPVSSDVESSHGVAAIDIDADGDDDLIFAMSKTFQDPESNNRLCL